MRLLNILIRKSLCNFCYGDGRFIPPPPCLSCEHFAQVYVNHKLKNYCEFLCRSRKKCNYYEPLNNPLDYVIL